MKEIRLEEYPDLKLELQDTEKDEVVYLKENGEEKYVVLSADVFEELDQLAEMFQNSTQNPGPNVKVITGPGTPELSYDEYENVKKQIIKALDENFKPNPEKLN